MEELLKLLAQYGLGAVFGGVCLWFYRSDRKDSETRYVSLAMDFKEIVQSNTEVNTRLCGLIEQHNNGHRKAA